PVTVAWDDTAPIVTLYRDARHVDDPFEVVLEFDRFEGGEGGERCWDQRSAVVRDEQATAVDGVVAVHVELPGALEPGAHAFSVRGAGLDGRGTVLAAPRRPTPEASRGWGLFAPVYALHDATRSAAGDLGTLRRFGAWAAGTGATVIGTLPMLAT